MESEVAQLPLWQKAWGWFEANRKQALWGGTGLVVVALVVSLFLYRQNETEVAAAEALSEVALPRMTGASHANLADGYLKVAATYPNSPAGARALILAAGGLFVEGKYADAKTQFERFTKDYTDSPFRGEALLGIAACLDAQGKTNEAVNAYKDLIDRHPTEYLLPQARFSLARLYEAQNKPELARNLFEEVERSNPYGSIGSEAGMRLEELKRKYPAIEIQPSPALTNALPLQPQKH